MWKNPPPVSRKKAGNLVDGKRRRKVRYHTQAPSVRDRLLKGIVSHINLKCRTCISFQSTSTINRYIKVHCIILGVILRIMYMNETLPYAEFSCLICRKVMVLPLTTPCAHNFCKSCLEGAFSGQTFFRQRKFDGWRTLRAQKNIMKCPSCSNDIFDFLKNPQVQL